MNKPHVVINTDDRKPQSDVTVNDYVEKEVEDDSKQEFFLVKIFRSGINFVFDFLETIVVALSVFVVIYLFIVQPHEVKGSSMEPTFQNNEYIITDKISYRFGKPNRGDVVIFKAPVNPDVDYIKRIIGLPGETVMVQSGRIYIDGKMLNEPYLEDLTPIFPGGFIKEGVVVSIPENHYFVMGDNRPHSSDSREFGPIEKKLIIGRAVFRYWPINNLGLIPGANYRY
ncbi:MAG: Signal peptidase I [Candidatus Gottesmanbacteria bacterium GW2011_GWA2_42_18]|uniref:Signal peptidase I n=1 Tax=Candidatus Gottesmanbacteria bacterium GW2011_GWA2_42_18 TaxID=1618442 RepID=A0A0G0ZDK6_9BACT|nr:MAG: Signal peptidase I [Candidatus Gottesmanbacteria bacterium GW2011_GWA2_42_18]KKS75867.1 MAG: Signal peptidase I [Candidatus Gottesmanbacteria bacterium GW2011_GWC2_42_8]